MLVYPQLATGALGQFPIQKRRRTRTVVNQAADGTSIKLGDPAAETIEWRLNYAGLSDAELEALQQFFTATEGSLQGFTFLDPTANLMSWSGQLDNAVWSRGSFLAVAGQGADPLGGTNAWHASNSGAGPQSICQTISAPGGYLYCLSAYARADQPTTVTMLRGTDRADRAVGTEWSRIQFAGSGDAAATSMVFGLELPAHATVDVFGLQVEPQGGASSYKAASLGGVYEGARFRDDILSFTTTAVNCHSATVNIIHASHL